MTDALIRHRCEVRFVLRMRAANRQNAHDYLATVEKRRGEEAANLLRNDVIEQWSRGARGAEGEWK